MVADLSIFSLDSSLVDISYASQCTEYGRRMANLLDVIFINKLATHHMYC